jgi:hypothetical protein
MSDRMTDADNLTWLALMQSYAECSPEFRERFDDLYRELKAMRVLQATVVALLPDLQARHAATLRDALDMVTVARLPR